LAKIEAVSGVKQHTVYKVDGKRVPGTTTIIGIMEKPFLKVWANQIGLQGIELNKYVDKLASIGTLAHYMIECHCRNESADLNAYSPEQIGMAENAFLSFLEWERGKEVEYIENELILTSPSFEYGGTIDIYCKVNGVATLADIKTAKAIYPEMFIQLAAYKRLLEENGYPVQDCRILRVGRDESEGFEDCHKDDLSTHWELFKCLRQAYELNKKINRKAG
jgi:hypothetical protein